VTLTLLVVAAIAAAAPATRAARVDPLEVLREEQEFRHRSQGGGRRMDLQRDPLPLNHSWELP